MSKFISLTGLSEFLTKCRALFYTKPSDGVPKTDLAPSVRASLDLADSSVQANPVGSVTPAVNPYDYATREELSQLGQEVNGITEDFSVVVNSFTWVTLSDYGVEGGDIIQVTSTATGYNLGIAFVDAGGSVISSTTVAPAASKEIVLPETATRFRMYCGTNCSAVIRFSKGIVGEIEEIGSNSVHINDSQALTETQKATARGNIDAASVGDVTIPETAEVNATDGFANWDYGYIKPNGSIQTASSGSWKYSDKIPIVPDTPIVISKMYCNTAVASVAAYDASDNFIADCSLSQSSRISESNPVSIPTTEKNVAYIRITVGGGYSDYNVTVTQYSGTKSLKEAVADIQEELAGINIGTQWNGKSWVALGTSITDTKNTLAPDGTSTGKFIPYLVALSGLVVTDKGVAGAVIGGHILYYAGHTAETATADIITIEGGVNDWAGDRPLGQVGDTVPYLVEWTSPVWNNGGAVDGTFAGACYQAIKVAMESSPNAVVVVLTDNTGRHIAETGQHCEREHLNGLGLKQKDYTDMLIAVAHYMGVPVINAGQKSMINQNNPEYLIDQIHQTELGGEQYANIIWSELKVLPLRIC